MTTCNKRIMLLSFLLLSIMVVTRMSASLGILPTLWFTHTGGLFPANRPELRGFHSAVNPWLNNIRLHFLNSTYVQVTNAKTLARKIEPAIFDPVTPTFNCSTQQRYGDDGDGGKVLCGIAALQAPCVIYSLGGNNQWDFEEAMLAATPCEVHTFDCFVSNPTKADTARFKFHRWCVSGSDNGMYLSLATILSRLGHGRNSISLLKMDIEYSEWTVFPALFQSRMLPQQISFELHTLSHTVQDVMNLFLKLHSFGYAVASKEINAAWPGGCEFTVLRVRQPLSKVVNVESLKPVISWAVGTDYFGVSNVPWVAPDVCGCSLEVGNEDADVILHLRPSATTPAASRNTGPHPRPWLLVEMESPHTMNPLPSTAAFDGIVSYRITSDVTWTALSMPSDLLSPLQPVMPGPTLFPDQAPVAYIASNCESSCDRDNFIQRLMRHVPVDSFGKCLHNREFPRGMTANDVAARYPFYFALENSDCAEYHSEKLLRPLKAGVIPLVHDSPPGRYDVFTSRPNAIVAVNHFPSMQALADFIKNTTAPLWPQFRRPGVTVDAAESWSRFKRSPATNPKFIKYWETHAPIQAESPIETAASPVASPFCGLCRALIAEKSSDDTPPPAFWRRVLRRWKLRAKTDLTSAETQELHDGLQPAERCEAKGGMARLFAAQPRSSLR